MDMLIENGPLLYAGVFTVGLLIGSFLNVVILRYPRMLNFDWRCQCHDLLEIEGDEEKPPPGLVFSRSFCPACGHAIRSWENIPLFSYISLGGKCSNCKSRISIRYPIIEFLTGIAFLVIIWQMGPTPQGLSALVLTSFLIAMTGIDIDHQLLPDTMTLPLMWTGIVLSFWDIHTNLSSSVIGALVGYLSLWSIYHLFRLLTGKEGMGYGDFKLMAALGAWIGWELLPLIILISSIAGALTGLGLMAAGKLAKNNPMPFGPFIALAGWIALIWGQQIIDIYLGASNFG